MHLLVILGALAAGPIEAPITDVTVYSDRARVVRSGEAAIDGKQTVTLPLLNDAADAATIQLEASGATVLSVSVQHVDEQDFPRDQARELLAEIQKLDDEIGEMNGAREARRQQLDQLQRITPSVEQHEPLKPAPRLSSQGWAAAIAFIDAAGEKLQGELAESKKALFELHREREKLAVRAAQLGGARRRSGHRVQATLSGHGKASLKLTYMVARSRWYPSYDVQFLPERGEAQISFAGQVSQESGEDWADSMLTLSTAVPATSRKLPMLLTWKIGVRERFIPTPAPQPPQPIAAPPAAPPLPQKAEHLEDQRLQLRLASIARAPPQPAEAAPGSGDEGDEGGAEGGIPGGVIGGTVGGMAGPPPAVAAAPLSKAKKSGRRYEKPAAPPPPPRVASAQPAMDKESMARVEEEVVVTASRVVVTASRSRAGEFALSPPPAYLPPSFAPDLPASLAGGYDLAFPALRKETVRSGGGPQRVPLFSESWPVNAERAVYPALAPDAAFLVARIENPSGRTLPGGPANLAVGADPAGTAQLELVAPGQSFTLPLGLDRAIKPIRNVAVVTEEKGLFSKDEVTHYTVTIELANPYRKELPVRVIDQVPLADNKEMNVELQKVEPPTSKRDPDKGTLEWSLKLPASGKQVVTFTYSLRRPKGYRLYQRTTRPQ